MLAGIVFTKMPERVLLAGTGGGSTARYFASRFPEVQGDAVELSSVIIDLAKDYFDCPYTGSWQLLQADIREYVKQCPHRYDLIVMDIAIDQYTPLWLVEPTFLQHCRALLTQQGHIAINLIVKDEQDFLNTLAIIRQVFDRQTICLSLTEHKNILVYAYNQCCQLSQQQIQQSLSGLQQVWQIEFNDFYQQMLKDNPADSGIL
jgi:spermidine synthase